MGMAPNGSPLLKMSFESAGKFLTEAAVHGRCDRLDGPSARLVLGKIVEAGTGECELLQKLFEKPERESSGERSRWC